MNVAKSPPVARTSLLVRSIEVRTHDLVLAEDLEVDLLRQRVDGKAADPAGRRAADDTLDVRAVEVGPGDEAGVHDGAIPVHLGLGGDDRLRGRKQENQQTCGDQTVLHFSPFPRMGP